MYREKNPMLEATKEEIQQKSDAVLSYLLSKGMNYSRLARATGENVSNLRKKLIIKKADPVLYIKVASALNTTVDDLFRVIFPAEMDQYFKK